MQRFEADLQTLELDQNASCEEIKQAYKDLVMVWHPDRFSHNPRLRQKAEAKLKLFNQAYEHLKGWRPAKTPKQSVRTEPPFVRHQANASTRRSSPRWQRSSRRTSPQSGPRRSGQAHSHSSRTSVNSPWISFADAEFILQRYQFKSLNQADHPQHQYQGGPFVLIACDAPPEVMISVPCDSLQMFDRILLSIPCKSMGHFIQQEAERLLQLLHAQDPSWSETQR